MIRSTATRYSGKWLLCLGFKDKGEKRECPMASVQWELLWWPIETANWRDTATATRIEEGSKKRYLDIFFFFFPASWPPANLIRSQRKQRRLDATGRGQPRKAESKPEKSIQGWKLTEWIGKGNHWHYLNLNLSRSLSFFLSLFFLDTSSSCLPVTYPATPFQRGPSPRYSCLLTLGTVEWISVDDQVQGR